MHRPGILRFRKGPLQALRTNMAAPRAHTRPNTLVLFWLAFICIMPARIAAAESAPIDPTPVNPPVDAPPFPDAPPAINRLGLSNPEVLVDTGVRNHGLVAQRIEGDVLLATCGEGGQSTPIKLATGGVGPMPGPHHTYGAIVCFDATGRIRWREDFRHETESIGISPFPSFIDVTGAGDWAITCVPALQKTGRPGEMRAYNLDGTVRWAVPVPGEKPWGNGCTNIGDLDGDGQREVIFSNSANSVCLDAKTGRILWTYADGVSTCHGRPVLTDLDGDGRPEYFLGSEYGDEKEGRLSSLYVLEDKGRVAARRRGLLGDFGSTPAVAWDVNGDGRRELLLAGQNLTWFKPRHESYLYVVDAALDDVVPPIPTGVPRVTVGDFDGDGHAEAIGIQDYRDGGPLREFAIVSADVSAGRIKWKREVPRLWLCGDPAAGDLDGDGQMEIAVSTNYPSGYAHQPDQAPWGDLYVVTPRGEIVYRHTFPDAVYAPIILDLDGDGKNEVVVACHDGKVYRLATDGKASTRSWPQVQANQQRTGHTPG